MTTVQKGRIAAGRCIFKDYNFKGLHYCHYILKADFIHFVHFLGLKLSF